MPKSKNWRKRVKGTPRQRGQSFQLGSGKVKGARKSSKYKLRKFKVGDFVRVKGNAVGTAWEFGKVMDINKNGAFIGYGSKNLSDDLRLHGARERVPLSDLEIQG